MKEGNKKRLTRKKSRKGGGSNIGYKYTRNENRRRWVDTLIPYSAQLASILPSIDWDAFEYEGPLVIKTKILETDKDVIITTTGTMISKLSYSVFGGAACELWGKAVPEVPIRKYVDFTADLDVYIILPRFEYHLPPIKQYTDDPCETGCELVIFNDDKYTEFGEAVTKFIYNEVNSKFLSLLLSVKAKGVSLPKMSNDIEIANSNLESSVGNFIVNRVISGAEKDMAKIQISTQINEDTHTTTDHLVEFIIPNAFSGSSTYYNRMKLNDIYVKHPFYILRDQISALINRGKIIKNMKDQAKGNNTSPVNSQYKFDNHCARILYLIKLLKFKEGSIDPSTGKTLTNIDTSLAVYILRDMVKGGISKLCDTSFNGNYIKEVIDTLESFNSIGKGALTFKIDPNYKRVFNYEKYY
jgi:hypothetical protein